MAKSSSLANRGCAFEDLIEGVFEKTPGVKMFRQSNKWIPLQGGRTGAFPKKGAPVDFVGVIDGVPIAIECKEIQSKRISLGEKRFPEKEIDALEEYELAGGKSFVFVAFWLEGNIAIYEFESFFSYCKSSKKSLTSQDANSILPVGKVLFVKKYLQLKGR